MLVCFIFVSIEVLVIHELYLLFMYVFLSVLVIPMCITVSYCIVCDSLQDLVFLCNILEHDVKDILDL